MDNGTVSTEMNLASQYALRVALQTMKERCISLQQRLSVVEDENQILRCRLEDDRNSSCNSSISSDRAESVKLKSQISELTRQKSQLSEHIAMVANENRKLWSRLSKIDKNQNDATAVKDNDCTQTHDTSPRSSANQNLIRSKTFTQHSPNPNLRHKIIPCNTGVVTETNFRDLSLEDVTLENFHESNVSGDVDDEEAAACDTNIGFTYLDVDANDRDFNLEAKKCIEGLQDIQREVLEQRTELNSAITTLESRISTKLHNCPDCEKRLKKPEMADKSLETDESITVDVSDKKSVTEPKAIALIDPVQDKMHADKMLKTCPMCGKTYSSVISFDDFREHVETHFLDDIDLEPSIDRNYEFISHAVGDF